MNLDWLRFGLNDAVTLQEDVFRDLIETHELTAQAIEQYADDWKKIQAPPWF